jgi:hypothetical protein
MLAFARYSTSPQTFSELKMPGYTQLMALRQICKMQRSTSTETVCCTYEHTAETSRHTHSLSSSLRARSLSEDENTRHRAFTRRCLPPARHIICNSTGQRVVRSPPPHLPSQNGTSHLEPKHSTNLRPHAIHPIDAPRGRNPPESVLPQAQRSGVHHKLANLSSHPIMKREGA